MDGQEVGTIHLITQYLNLSVSSQRYDSYAFTLKLQIFKLAKFWLKTSSFLPRTIGKLRESKRHIEDYLPKFVPKKVPREALSKPWKGFFLPALQESPYFTLKGASMLVSTWDDLRYDSILHGACHHVVTRPYTQPGSGAWFILLSTWQGQRPLDLSPLSLRIPQSALIV